MKKILFLLLVSVFVAVSCSDDTNKSSNIVGTWARESIAACAIESNNPEVVKFINNDIRSYNQHATDKYIFSENGLVLFIDTTYTDEGLFEATDTTIVFSYSKGENIVVPVSILDNKLSLFTDETEYYQDWINFLFPDKNIEVSKVITKYTYQKK